MAPRRRSQLTWAAVRNVKRNDMELRDEADVLHRRQPYAVLFALFFMPKDSSWDGNWTQLLRARGLHVPQAAGRSSADAARPDLFEKVYIGLFTDDGSVEFFDVEEAPPRNQPPKDTISLAELIEVMRAAVTLRNEGVAPEERYAADDEGWTAPEGSLPEDIEIEEPLDFEEAIEGAEEIDEDG